jgi:hypothetical protein
MSILMTTAHKLLVADKRSLTEISEQSQIPYHWLKSFRYNAIKDPSVNRVQQLYTFLSGQPLRIENVLA